CPAAPGCRWRGDEVCKEGTGCPRNDRIRRMPPRRHPGNPSPAPPPRSTRPGVSPPAPFPIPPIRHLAGAGRVARLPPRVLFSPCRRTGMLKYLLKLYVTGQTPRSQQAIVNLRRLCEQELGGAYEMVVIDVLERPQLAEDQKILATPTVVKELPGPIRRII